jgi:pimeloyl-ACP methyl ester carboxylesterase
VILQGAAPKSVRVDGHEGVGINVWDYGGTGPTLLLCHCTGTHGRIWDPIAPLLTPHFRVLAPDTRGHGDSDKPDDLDLYSWHYSGHDLYNIIQQLDLKTPLLAVGHSAGGTQLCYCELDRPGTFEKLLLIDPIIGPEAAVLSPNPMGEAARRRKEVFPSFASVEERLGSKPPMNAWTPEMLTAYVRHGFYEGDDGQVHLKCPGRVEGAVYDRGGAPDVYDRLSDLTCDIALVTSDNSNVHALIELQHERLGPHEYIELEGPSHFIPQEIPETVAEIILNRFAKAT